MADMRGNAVRVFSATLASLVFLTPTLPVHAATIQTRGLDLSSTHRGTAAPIGIEQHLQIIIGGHTQDVGVNTHLTAAEALAVQQILTTGRQTIVIGAHGNAVGGQAILPSSTALTSLRIPRGITVLRDFAQGDLTISGGLIDAGHLYGFSSDSTVNTAVISAGRIIVEKGGLISTVLPSTLSSSINNAVAGLSLELQSSSIRNAGIISSAGELTIASANHNLLIDNRSGVLSAGSDINLINSTAGARNLTNILGGDLLSKSVNIDGGNGTVNLDVDKLTGVLNVNANCAHILASTDNLQLGKMNVAADPTYFNSNGDLTLTGDLTATEKIALLASGNVDLGNNFTVQALSPSGNGADITIVAGAQITKKGSGAVDSLSVSNVTGNPIPSTATISATNPAAGATGGSIICTNCTINSSGSGMNKTGGRILLAAYSGMNPGQINISGTIISDGTGTGHAGNITLIAPFIINLGSSAIAESSASTPATITIAGAAPKGTITANSHGAISGALAPGILTGGVIINSTVDVSGQNGARGGTIAITSATGTNLNNSSLNASGGLGINGIDGVTNGQAGSPGKPGGNGGTIKVTSLASISAGTASLFASGNTGGQGGNGATGTSVKAAGGNGGKGAAGGRAGSISITAHDFDLSQSAIQAQGGDGGDGGTGGNGVTSPGGIGGAGGAGGSGGAAGKGGLITFSSTTTGSVEVISANGGTGGLGESPGTSATTTQAGANGPSGANSGNGGAGGAGGTITSGASTNLNVIGVLSADGGRGGQSLNGAAGGSGGLNGGTGGKSGNGGKGGAGGQLLLNLASLAYGTATGTTVVPVSASGGQGGETGLGNVGGFGTNGNAGNGGGGGSNGAGGNGGVVKLTIATGGSVSPNATAGSNALLVAGNGGDSPFTAGDEQGVTGNNSFFPGKNGGNGGAGGSGGAGGRGGTVSISFLVGAFDFGQGNGGVSANGGFGSDGGGGGQGGDRAPAGNAGNGGKGGKGGDAGSGGSIKISVGSITSDSSASLAASGGKGGNGGSGGDAVQAGFAGGKSGGSGGSGGNGGKGGSAGTILLNLTNDTTFDMALTAVGIRGGNGGSGGKSNAAGSAGGNGGSGGAGGSGGTSGTGGSLTVNSTANVLFNNFLSLHSSNGAAPGTPAAGSDGFGPKSIGGAGGAGGNGGSSGRGGKILINCTGISKQLTAATSMSAKAGNPQLGTAGAAGGNGATGGRGGNGGANGNGGAGGTVILTDKLGTIQTNGIFDYGGTLAANAAGAGGQGGAGSAAAGGAGGNGGFAGNGGNGGLIIRTAQTVMPDAGLDVSFGVAGIPGSFGAGGAGTPNGASGKTGGSGHNGLPGHAVGWIVDGDDELMIDSALDE